jgi:hypothetical protein
MLVLSTGGKYTRSIIVDNSRYLVPSMSKHLTSELLVICHHNHLVPHPSTRLLLVKILYSSSVISLVTFPMAIVNPWSLNVNRPICA